MKFAAAVLKLKSVAKLAAYFARWRVRRQQRDELVSLSARELRDIGITPYDARKEADKRRWRS